jgi:rhodanese-related sulfurtransferase
MALWTKLLTNEQYTPNPTSPLAQQTIHFTVLIPNKHLPSAVHYSNTQHQETIGTIMMRHRAFSMTALLTTVLARQRTAVAFAPPAFRRCFFATTTIRHAEATGFASHDDIRTALSDERARIVDVRRPEEILESGYWQQQQTTSTSEKDDDALKTNCHQWIHVPCTPTDAALLEMTASSLFPDKSAPIVVHCALGKRAAKAKQVLDDLGYTNVLNAGGWSEVKEFRESIK